MAESGGGPGLGLIIGGSAAALLLLFLGRKQVKSAAEAVEEEVLEMAGRVKAVDQDGVSQGYRPLVHDIESQAIWDAVVGPVKNAVGERSSFSYDAVIDQFYVATNPRYKPRILEGGATQATFCNVFVQDVIAASVTAPLSRRYAVPSGVVTLTGLDAEAGAPLEMCTSRVSGSSSPGAAPGSEAGKECFDSRSTIEVEVEGVA